MATSETNFTFETNFDLNALFHLSYNFDLLKGIIEGLLKNQKSTNEKLMDIQEHMSRKDRKINDLEKEIGTLNILLRSDGGPKEAENTTLNVNLGGDETTNKLIRKVNYLEGQITNLLAFSTDIADLKKKVKDHDGMISDHDKILFEINEKLNRLNEQVDDHTRKLQDLNLKLMDLNIVDILKSKGGEGVEGDSTLAINMISSLEKKYNQKFKYIDERSAKIEEDLYKLKSDLQNLKNSHDLTNKNVSAIKEQIEIIFGKLEDLKANIKNTSDLNNGIFNDKLDKLKSYVDDKFQELNTTLHIYMSNQNDNPKEAVLVNQGLSDTDMKLLKDLSKRVAELEKALKLLNSQINMDNIWKEFAKINEILNTKADIQTVNELREMIIDLQKQLNFIRDIVNTLSEDKTTQDDILQLKKKVENISNSIHALKGNDESNSNSYNKAMPIDTSKFVELAVFNEFKSNAIKEFEVVHENLNDIRKILEEIINNLKNKVTDKDLKSLEDFFLVKIEELKSACNKKYADKNETAKNLKYLDQQIKQIIEVYIKKMEKGDNWLLAKKPLGGYSCASCEAYIGDLRDNTQYIPWNKYPMRDPNDKLYRIGNGFSKMLQMINIEPASGKKEGSFQTSYDFYKPSSHHEHHHVVEESHVKKEMGLPKLYQQNNLNNSADDIGGDMEEGSEGEDPNQPKM